MKTGATYTFWLNGSLVNTVSNPGWERINQQAKPGNEPDIGAYGLALAGPGEASKISFREIHLATKYSGNPVLEHGPKGSWDENEAFTAGVLHDGDTFYLYYTGIDATDPKQEGGGYGRLGVATSHDLIHWTKYARNPLLGPSPAGAWDSHHLQFGPVTKIRDGSYAVTYQAWDDKTHRWTGIGVAFGTNPLGPFAKFPGNPVLRASSDPKDFDGNHTHLHTVIREDDGTFAMLYTGFSDRFVRGPGDRGGLATSKDMIHWEKFPGNPVYDLGTPGAWDDAHVRPKSVVKFRGWYYMFHEGAHLNGKTWFDQVGMARSKDLIHWDCFPLNPIIPLDTASGRDSIVTEWPCAVIMDDKLYVLYWGGGPGRVAISLAEIPNEVLAAWGGQ